LLLAVLSFVLAARACPGVQRISLLGSILTAKAIPKDIDVLVTIEGAMDLDRTGARWSASYGDRANYQSWR
jgi:predicted nucleotidyltransferase